MIVGVGIDVVEIARIAEAMERDRFIDRVLTPAERAACTGPEWLAGRWAAKEALQKCLSRSISWQDVEVLNMPNGKPLMRFMNRKEHEIDYKLHVSISHERSVATALVVVELLSAGPS